MLTVTEAAAEAIATLSAGVGGSGEGGLRIASTDGSGRLAVSVAPTPANGDRVVKADGGAQVFLDPGAVELLDDKALDVREGTGDEVTFVVVAHS